MDFISGNIFVREMRFDRVGGARDGHRHNFDHTTYVVRGAIRIEQLAEDGSVVRAVEKRAVDGRNWVLIRAQTAHRVTALEANTIAHCIYSHRDPQGVVVQEWGGWEEATV
jgi:quercetin dioxygenase-like cupin family protein